MLQQFHNTHIRDKLSNNFHLHLTPDFAKVPAKRPDGTKVGGDKMMRYKYMNKPFGLLHWMENVLRKNETARNDDDIVILMDPDMILLRPIVHDYTNENVIFVEENPKSKIVSHGHPMAQQDGYLSNQWMGLNATYITGREIPSSVNPRAGPTHYNTGPPVSTLQLNRLVFLAGTCVLGAVDASHCIMFPNLLICYFLISIIYGTSLACMRTNTCTRTTVLGHRSRHVQNRKTMGGIRPSRARCLSKVICRNVWVYLCYCYLITPAHTY